ncbi:hypothetical protein QTN47_11370 [Danxiaibacter flavus]|uniref:Dialkylresorcinol condensing enzyme DarA n=1 Tax=Danxiaibacter flavus TaxID=3049108 RepID=A0ABV3ZI63_9BACT|nr:hypothetical protein QNM32_11375 [Chitinophagaceae bacterium DXS]
MQKKVLAVYYSQSGQLGEIIDNFCEPLIQAGASVEKVRIRLKNDYPFPWTGKRFFSVMPDCVLGTIAELEPFQLQSASYDLVILGYQAWFLSPSIPFNSMMHHPALLNVLKDAPVITVTGARNMWVNAFEKIKKLINNAGAKHVGTIALVDKHLNLVSIFTIFHWMIGGRKTKYLGFFPRPGVSPEDIANTKIFGETTLSYLQKNEWNGLKEELIEKKAVVPKFHLLFMESKAGVMFKIWANIIAKSKKRDILLVAFKYYLLIALFIFAPIVFIIDLLFFKPFLSRYVRRKKEACLKLN